MGTRLSDMNDRFSIHEREREKQGKVSNKWGSKFLSGPSDRYIPSRIRWNSTHDESCKI